MAIELNHTIVPARDQVSAAQFFATAATDEQIAEWIGEHARKRPQSEIDIWNKREGAVRVS